MFVLLNQQLDMMFLFFEGWDMDSWRVTHNAGAECFSKIQQCLGECGLYQSGADGQKNTMCVGSTSAVVANQGLGWDFLNLCIYLYI